MGGTEERFSGFEGFRLVITAKLASWWSVCDYQCSASRCSCRQYCAQSNQCHPETQNQQPSSPSASYRSYSSSRPFGWPARRSGRTRR